MKQRLHHQNTKREGTSMKQQPQHQLDNGKMTYTPQGHQRHSTKASFLHHSERYLGLKSTQQTYRKEKTVEQGNQHGRRAHGAEHVSNLHRHSRLRHEHHHHCLGTDSSHHQKGNSKHFDKTHSGGRVDHEFCMKHEHRQTADISHQRQWKGRHSDKNYSMAGVDHGLCMKHGHRQTADISHHREWQGNCSDKNYSMRHAHHDRQTRMERTGHQHQDSVHTFHAQGCQHDCRSCLKHQRGQFSSHGDLGFNCVRNKHHKRNQMNAK